MTREFIIKRIKEQEDYISHLKSKQHISIISRDRAKLLINNAIEIKNIFKDLLIYGN